ncbi:MAG: hypothetical protein RJQ14_01710 [Marinoscillum sp.]
MSHNQYQREREAKNTLPGFIFLIVVIISVIWAIRFVAVYINDYFVA